MTHNTKIYPYTGINTDCAQLSHSSLAPGHQLQVIAKLMTKNVD